MNLSDDEKIDILTIGVMARQLELEALAEMTGHQTAKALRKMLKRR
jgi:hypothetical protein